MSENANGSFEIIGIIIICVIGLLFFSAMVFSGCALRAVRDEAVDAGVAEYYIDSAHDKAFRWKTNSIAR